MRKFFSNYWKVILAIVLAIVLATLTLETKSGTSALSTRLAQHARMLEGAGSSVASHYISTALAHQQLVPTRTLAGSITRIEAAFGNVAPGTLPARTIIIGAHLGPDGNAGAVLALELAGALRRLRPTPGTEIRFVFIVHETSLSHARRSNFLAFVGAPPEAARARQQLATLQGQVPHGLATPAHALGITGFSGDGPAGLTGLATDGVFHHYPYLRTGDGAGRACPVQPGREPVREPVGEPVRDPDPHAVQAMAQVVRGLARAIGALAGVVEA